MITMIDYVLYIRTKSLKESISKKGWVPITEQLPSATSEDWINKGFTEYSVMDSNGKVFTSRVGVYPEDWRDSIAAPLSITHVYYP